MRNNKPQLISIDKRFYDDLLTDLDRMEKELSEKTVEIVAIPTHTSKTFDFKDLNMYVVKLTEPTQFADCAAVGDLNHPELQFESMVLFSKREFEDEFHFSDMPLFFPDVDLVGQASSGWLVLTKWLPDNTPALFVAFTERDVEEFMDFITTANAQRVTDIYVEVLERMYLDMRNSFQKFSKRLEAANFMAEKDRYEKEKFMNDVRDRVMALDNATQNRLNAVAPSTKFKDRLSTMPLWANWLLGAGWIAAFIMAFFI
jgi:hypothetical protein